MHPDRRTRPPATQDPTLDLFGPRPGMDTEAGHCRMVTLVNALVWDVKDARTPSDQFAATVRRRLAAVAARHPEATAAEPLDYLLATLNPVLVEHFRLPLTAVQVTSDAAAAA